MKVAKLNEIAQVSIGDNVFCVRKFRAFPSARISGNVIALLAPLLGGAGALFDAWGGSDDGGDDGGADNSSLLNQDIASFLPDLAEGLAKLDGRKLEVMLGELLIDEGCISYDGNRLTQDMVDEVFCGDLKGMLTLAVEVIKLNYGSLFTLLGFQFGSREDQKEQMEILT